MPKEAPAWIKYTTAGRGGLDKYELCFHPVKIICNTLFVKIGTNMGYKCGDQY